MFGQPTSDRPTDLSKADGYFRIVGVGVLVGEERAVETRPDHESVHRSLDVTVPVVAARTRRTIRLTRTYVVQYGIAINSFHQGCGSVVHVILVIARSLVRLSLPNNNPEQAVHTLCLFMVIFLLMLLKQRFVPLLKIKMVICLISLTIVPLH